MSTIRRGIVAAALAFPIALGTAGIASADTGYDSGSSNAGPDGTGTSQTTASTSGQGSSFEQSGSWAGEDGASHQSTEAHAGQGASSFEHNSDSASADGASSSHTSSHAGGYEHTGTSQQQGGALSGVLSGIGL